MKQKVPGQHHHGCLTVIVTLCLVVTRKASPRCVVCGYISWCFSGHSTSIVSRGPSSHIRKRFRGALRRSASFRGITCKAAILPCTRSQLLDSRFLFTLRLTSTDMCERVPWTPRCVNTALKLDVALLQSRMEFPGHGKDSAAASVETTARSLSPFGAGQG